MTRPRVALPGGYPADHNRGMDRPGLQFSLTSMLALVACVAINFWCFRVSAILGFVALNVTKHVVIAQLCQAVGLNRREVPKAASPEARA